MNRTQWTGALAALATAGIGAGWQITSRHGVTTTLGPIEVAWLRYGVPALLLAPILLRRAWTLRAPHALLLVATGGLPFGLLVLGGLQFAPAAHLGVFMAGTIPLFTALGCWLVLGERVRGWRWVGLAFVAAGVATLGSAAWTGDATGTWRGDLLFLAAAAVWSVYTIALRRSGIDGWQSAALTNTGSTIVLLLLLPWLAPLRLASAPWGDIALQAGYQGVLAGIAGQALFTVAVVRLGAARAALSAALVPLLTIVGAAVLLRERVDTATLAAGALVAMGIVLAALPPRGDPGAARN